MKCLLFRLEASVQGCVRNHLLSVDRGVFSKGGGGGILYGEDILLYVHESSC